MAGKTITIRVDARVMAWIFGLGVLGALLCVGATHPIALTVNKTFDLTHALSSLAVVAILVERIIEVFVTLWSDPAKDALDLQLENDQILFRQLTDAIALLEKEKAEPNTTPARKTQIDTELAAKRSARDAAETKIGEDKEVLVPFTAGTRRMALWFGMLIGVLAAAVGFRLLNQVVDTSSIHTKPTDGSAESYNLQYTCFVVLDVLLTGAILAGGTKAIHAVFTLYDAFMQRSRELAEKPK